LYFFYITDRKHRNTLPNNKRKHKHRRSIAPDVKEDEGQCISGCLAILIMCSSFIKRLIKVPFSIPVKVSVFYSNVQLSFNDDIPNTCSTKALKSYEIITVERVCVCVCGGGLLVSANSAITQLYHDLI